MKYFLTVFFLTVMLSFCGISMANQAIEPSLKDTSEENMGLLLQSQQQGNSLNEQEDQENSEFTLPPYSLQVIAKRANDFIAIFCVLDRPIDKLMLRRLGRDCYKKIHGQEYHKVHMNWYLEGKSKKDKPWGVTNFSDNGLEVAIF